MKLIFPILGQLICAHIRMRMKCAQILWKNISTLSITNKQRKPPCHILWLALHHFRKIFVLPYKLLFFLGSPYHGNLNKYEE